MNILKLLTDSSPGGYQDRQPIVCWLVKICAIFSGNVWTASRIVGVLLVIWLFAWSAWASFIAFLFFAWTD